MAARKRKIQIIRGRSLSFPPFLLDDGEFGLERSYDGLSLGLYIGTPTGNKLVGMDMNSDAFKQFILNGVLPDDILRKINNSLQWDKVGDGLIGTEPDTVSLGTPSAITATSGNTLTSTSHTHLLQNNAVTNSKLNIMPANTLKGALVKGDPIDLTLDQVKEMLGISDIGNFNDASKLTKGTLHIDRIADYSITEIKLSKEVQDKLNNPNVSITEVDPWVADWARKPNAKPTYTVGEISGALSIEEFNKWKSEFLSGLMQPVWDGDTLTFTNSGIDIEFSNLLVGCNYTDFDTSLIFHRFDGGAFSVDVSKLKNPYVGSDGDHIKITVDPTNHIHGELKPGSINRTYLSQSVIDELNEIENKYVLAHTGIPLSDLSQAVQDRLVPTSWSPYRHLRRNATNTAMEWVDSCANLTSQQALFGQAARHGTLYTFARSDHYHALPAGADIDPTPLTPTVQQGVSNTFARADHRHAIPLPYVVSATQPASNPANNASFWIRTGTGYGNGVLHYNAGTLNSPIWTPLSDWYTP